MILEWITRQVVILGVSCGDTSFFGIPSWHNGAKVLGPTDNVPNDGIFTLYLRQDAVSDSCSVLLDNLGSVWVIAANIVRMMLSIGVYVAIGFVIYGALMVMVSQGVPDKIASGKGTIINAAIGLIICLVATNVVGLAIGFFAR